MSVKSSTPIGQKEGSIMQAYDYFAALIYVTDTEHEAVMRMFDWQEVTLTGDDQIYYIYEISNDNQKKKIVAARQDEMGMCASATLSMKLREQFRPQYLIMPGIAAGTRNFADQQMYGDVLISNLVWNYSNGKYVAPQNADITFGNIGFIPRPSWIQTDPKILKILEKAIKDPRNECYVHVGPLASGSAVVANGDIVDMQVRSQFDETIGLEMEAYGVLYAAKHAVEPKPYAIIAKSICDFADSQKDDNYQKFAAYTSCEFVKNLCLYFLPDVADL